MKLYDWNKAAERPEFAMRRRFEKEYLAQLKDREDDGDLVKDLTAGAWAQVAWEIYKRGFIDGTAEAALAAERCELDKAADE